MFMVYAYAVMLSDIYLYIIKIRIIMKIHLSVYMIDLRRVPDDNKYGIILHPKKMDALAVEIRRSSYKAQYTIRCGAMR